MKTKVDYEVQFRSPGKSQVWWCGFYRQIRPDAEDLCRFRELRRGHAAPPGELMRVVRVVTTEKRSVVGRVRP